VALPGPDERIGRSVSGLGMRTTQAFLVKIKLIAGWRFVFRRGRAYVALAASRIRVGSVKINAWLWLTNQRKMGLWGRRLNR